MTWFWFGLSGRKKETADICLSMCPPPSSNSSEIAVAVGLALVYGECGRLSCLVIPCCCESAAFSYKCWILNSCHYSRDVMSVYLNWVTPYVKWGSCGVSAWTQYVKWGRSMLCLPYPNWVTKDWGSTFSLNASYQMRILHGVKTHFIGRLLQVIVEMFCIL